MVLRRKKPDEEIAEIFGEKNLENRASDDVLDGLRRIKKSKGCCKKRKK